MKIVERLAAQGDVLFRRVSVVPVDATEVKRESDEPIVVAHSETGHHHVVKARRDDAKVYATASALLSFLVLTNRAEVEHQRIFDTHESLCLEPGVWEVRRQRERAPEGWRRVED
jgi:hypothetical protein